ncbi:NRDE family protein [Nocardiopsis sp. MG754419]|uniref:NRDE family protein n=1 Tax=Nocardiopsis sp. MG754419 TaxID=2259865 RepID=UPI001BA5C94F|nr:NRDE family protein [Nocardiopsis sp. MG754419]MBR8744000.1 NRDE family protein [Nocardiopsis sp. MG754419]
MCTVIVAFDPDATTPLVVAALRDEMRSRPWDGPGHHWPDHPGVIGGRDRLAGGTWLAVDPTGPRTAALLNGWPWDGRMPWEGTYPASRGDLPLHTLARHARDRRGGRDPLEGEDPTRYAPFHLLDADTRRATLHSWDGRCLDARPLPPGVTTIVNTGLDPDDPRAARHTPEFARTRPDPDLGDPALDLPDPGEAAASVPGSDEARGPHDAVRRIWGEWPRLITEAAGSTPRSAGVGPTPGDPSALIAHADLGNGQVWGTGSVTLLAFGRGEVRYAFTDTPARPEAWRMIPARALRRKSGRTGGGEAGRD